jgi:Mg-chelatase subunit ChlD
VGALGELVRLAQEALVDWSVLRFGDTGFWHQNEARLAILAMVSVAVAMLLLRVMFRRSEGSQRVTLPGFLSAFDDKPIGAARHLPLALFLAGVPFLVAALSDPHSSLVRQSVSFPGRRISLMVDASASMATPFEAAELASNTAFATTVAAAERFVELRREGRYRDLIALIEFGTRAYVITPFTSDYDNVLLSASLIGHPDEFAKFPDKATFIGLAIEQSIELYRAFDFLDASGNLMVIFSDGEDERVTQGGRTVADIVAEAIEAEIPIYFIRTNADKLLGDLIPDRIWREAVESTGGKFFAAANEATILEAIKEIDRASEGTIAVKRFTAQRPLFAPLAAIALLLWSTAAALKLTFPQFRTFP